MARNLFDIKNVLTTFKAIIVSFVIMIVGWFIRLITYKIPVASSLLLLIWFVFAFLLWGYLADRFWSWE